MEIRIEVRMKEADRGLELKRLEAYRKAVCEVEKKVDVKEEK